MEFGYLGKAGVKVSKICLGTGGFGEFHNRQDYGGVPKDEAFRIMDCALDHGINFFDTANVYGGVGHRGASETIIGEWFSQGQSRRERVVLGTKVGREFEQDEIDGPNRPFGLSIYKIRRHFEASLRRLRCDHIELYQMHRFDPYPEWDELWEAFECLVRQGKVDYVGSCNFSGGQLAEAQAVAERRGYMGLVTAQHRYNLVVRDVEVDLIPTAQRLRVGVTVWSPLARGLLAVDFGAQQPGPLSTDAASQADHYHQQLVDYSKLCREVGATPAAVSAAWLLRNPAISSVILGPSSVRELEDGLGALDVVLDDDIVERIEEIFPAPARQFVVPSERTSH